MHLADVVLFLHIFIAICAFACAAILHTSQFVSRGATTTGTLKAWAPVAHRVEPLFPILALILFALGAWLLGLSDGEFKWSDGWVIASIVGLFAMEAAGGVVLAPAGKKLHEAIMTAPDGPVDGALRAQVLERTVWAVSFFETATALGIVFLMTNKPSGVASGIIVGACALAGLAIGAAAARQPAPVVLATSVPAAAQADGGQL
jgi:hypothetical protein